MLLLRPDVRVDAVARGNICNIREVIAELECRAGGPVVSDHLVSGWLQKFQFGYGKRLRSWDEEVSSNLDKRDIFSLKIDNKPMKMG